MNRFFGMDRAEDFRFVVLGREEEEEEVEGLWMGYDVGTST